MVSAGLNLHHRNSKAWGICRLSHYITEKYNNKIQTQENEKKKWNERKEPSGRRCKKKKLRKYENERCVTSTSSVRYGAPGVPPSSFPPRSPHWPRAASFLYLYISCPFPHPAPRRKWDARNGAQGMSRAGMTEELFPRGLCNGKAWRVKIYLPRPVTNTKKKEESEKTRRIRARFNTCRTVPFRSSKQ